MHAAISSVGSAGAAWLARHRRLSSPRRGANVVDEVFLPIEAIELNKTDLHARPFLDLLIWESTSVRSSAECLSCEGEWSKFNPVYMSYNCCGESMENALCACCKGIKIGKVLIHRVGDNGQQLMLIYHKLPMDIAERHVLLLDPVLGTGNSVNQAIELLIRKGVPEDRIIFLNLISAPEGIQCVCKRFPLLKIVTSEIDYGLNEEFRVIPPGLGGMVTVTSAQTIEGVPNLSRRGDTSEVTFFTA